MSKSITDILWNFYHELKEQQDSGRSVREGNAEIISQTKSALLKIILGEKPKKKRKGKYWTAMQIQGFNQCTDEYEAKIKELFK